MPLTSFLESIKTDDTDSAEGSLLLCESDLISSLLVSNYAAAQSSALAHTADVSGVLHALKGKVNVGAC